MTCHVQCSKPARDEYDIEEREVVHAHVIVAKPLWSILTARNQLHGRHGRG